MVVILYSLQLLQLAVVVVVALEEALRPREDLVVVQRNGHSHHRAEQAQQIRDIKAAAVSAVATIEQAAVVVQAVLAKTAEAVPPVA